MIRYLLPTLNPLGFAPADYIFLGLAMLVVVVFVFRSSLLSLSQRLAQKTIAIVAILFALPIVLRLALLGHHPVPTPRVADDFSYLLLGDTLAHFRLANAMHPMRRFFEAVFVLQDPSYSSIYPPGQGIALALGQLLFHQPWAGVVMSIGALSALCYWMLRAWVPPAWALLGGLLAAIQFGPLSPWMNTYWGGAVSAIAGCLIFGALPRRRPGLLALGLSLQLLTRPFEFVLLLPIVLLFRFPPRKLMFTALLLLPAAGVTLLQNQQVTGHWLTLPYQLSREQYGIPATFTFQSNPVPHRPLTVEQKVDYDAQIAVHDAAGNYFKRLVTRLRFYRFFFLAPLYLALPFLFLEMRRSAALKDMWLPAASLFLLILGDAFYPYFYPHYQAAATCLFILLAVVSLRQLSGLRKLGPELATLIVTLCVAHFLFWYSLHATNNQATLAALSPDDTWDSLNSDSDPEGRAAINRKLESSPGAQLVFVRYSAQHGAREWIHNAAEIDRAQIVWALDLGDAENAALRRYYPARHAWILEADSRPPALIPY